VNNRSFSSAFLTAIIISGLILVGTAHFSTAQASDVTGIISSNTTWTKSSSPYSLTGPVTIGNGVTLTIEAGVTVNLNGYNIQVNGILYARGSSADNIIFTSDPSSSGGIAFTSDSTSWNEQTASGCIIENSVLDSVSISISNASPKLSTNFIIASANAIDGSAIFIDSGSPIISKNIIKGDIENLNSASPTISNNSITGGIYGMGELTSSPTITYNNIKEGSWRGFGIRCDGINVYVADNVVSNCPTAIIAYDGTAIIERNLVFNNVYGITIGGMGAISPTIRNNTIANNKVGIYISAGPSGSGSIGSLTIINNNIQENSDHSIFLAFEATKDIDAAYNWWGTTDAQSISQSIFDVEDYSNLGKVTFTPFLNEPNPEATPRPLPTPTDSPTPTPPSAPSPIPVPDQSFFFVESNSTISELFFNSTSSELSFTVSGTSGTAGYVKFTIAKSLLSSVQNVKVYLDGSQLNVAITEDADSWLLSFTYMHSTHHVRISLATNTATTLLGIEYWISIGVIIIVVIGVGLLLYLKKRKH
jgi:hypothetical protein